ncbi:MAG: rRNA methyltransferase, partial [Actinobacteria bacterium]|nr:rRNA methyltransferase [Actinomycetota bacterium]
MTQSSVGPGEFYQVVGVGPHSKPWPTDNHFDPELLEQGDRRNVLDKYRYWKVE